MPEREQMLCCQPAGGLVIETDAVEVVVERPDDHHRHIGGAQQAAGLLGTIAADQNETIDAVRQHGADDRSFRRQGIIMRGDQQLIAHIGKRVLHALDRAREYCGVERGDDDAHRAAQSRSQRPAGAVRKVAEPLGYFSNPLLGIAVHQFRPRQRARNGGDRDARRARYIMQSRTEQPLHWHCGSLPDCKIFCNRQAATYAR